MNNDDLRAVLLNTKIPLGDKLLLILYAHFGTPLTGTQIKEIAYSLGVADVYFWKTSETLRDLYQYAIRSRTGWLLTPEGRDYVLDSGLVGGTSLITIISNVRQHAAAITDVQTKGFIEEAISCYEHKFFRAAIVLSWVGAVALLYNYVIQHRLADFNAEALRRDSRWKAAVTADDLAHMKESDFLDILVRLSIIGKNVKQELVNCLTLRNACGHPNSLVVGESRVAAHLEILVDNVFAKFV
ncbi:MAG TPA: hypothetical protein VGD31_17000 [Sphingobacteriaceae bacterium]